MWTVLATLHCKSTKLSELSLNPTYFKKLEVGEMRLQLCRIGSSHNGKGVGCWRVRKKRKLLNIWCFNTFQIYYLLLLFKKVKKGFPFETLLSATKVYSHFWDFKSTGYFHKILLQCYLESSRKGFINPYGSLELIVPSRWWYSVLWHRVGSPVDTDVSEDN